MLTKQPRQSVGTAGVKGMLINRNFTLLWCGQTVSILGNLAFSTTIVLWIADYATKNQPWAPLAVSGALLANYVPIFLFGLPAGVFVDRWNKRRITLSIDASSAVVVGLFLASIMVFPFSSHGSTAGVRLLIVVYVVVFVLNAGSQFFKPALLTLIGDIVEGAERGRAVGLNQLSNNMMTIIAPPLATFLFFSIGVQWLLLLDMISFVFSFFSLSFIQASQSAAIVRQKSAKHFLEELLSGFMYALDDRKIVVLSITTATGMVGAGALNALDLFFLSQNLHTSQRFYGVLDMVFGIGLVVGALLANMLIKHVGRLRIVWSSQILIGILIIAYSRMTMFLPATILLFLAGVPLAVTTIAVDSLLLQIIAREMLGRVLSILNVVSALELIIGSYIAGLLASVILYHFPMVFLGIHLSSLDTIISGAGILVVLSGCSTSLCLHRKPRIKTCK